MRSNLVVACGLVLGLLMPASGAVVPEPVSPSGPEQSLAATTTVVFQQGTDGYIGAVDTYLHAGLPDANNAAATTLIVDGPTAGAPGDQRQILLRFDGLFASAGGPLPDGAVIQSATLTVNITNPSVDGAELHRMLRAWSGADTWNTLGAGVQRDGVEAVAAADVTSAHNGTVPSLYTINVTASLAAWSAGAINRGWVFVTPGSGSDSWRFDSSEGATIASRPKLTVTYYTNQPPNAPANPSPTDGARGVTVDADLCVDVSDPDSSRVDVHWYGREIGGVTGEDFTVVVLPDSQVLSRDRPDIFDAQMDWIVANREARRIVFVTSVGDTVDDGGSTTQWDNAEAALARLENPAATGLTDGIPYGLAIGNHDQSPYGTTRSGGDETATTQIYNQRFGRDRFQARTSYYGGAYDFGDPARYGDNRDNHYELFSASGMNFLVLHLEADFTASVERNAVLKWADGVLQSHGDRRAIVVVHYLIDTSAAWSNQGSAVYEEFKDNPNVFLMLSGHLDTAARRTDTYQTSTIHTVLQDYQAHGSVPDGWLRLYTFQPQSSSIHVQTYSPIQDTYQTDSANDFTLPYTMESGPPFASIGSVTGAAAPSRQCTTWAGRESGKTYEWYATAADADSTTTGPRWSFSVSCASDPDCDDGDICTTDTCSAGTCQYAEVTECCTTSADCLDADPCTVDSCDASANACVHDELNCDDGNACTADSCAAGACGHAYTPAAGCCVSAASCDDGNMCTTDACDIVPPATTGDCTNTPNAACCSTGADCDDGDPCTTDQCQPSNNSSLIFDGVDDHITMGAAPGLGASTFTIEVWIKWDGDGTSTSTGSGGLTAAIPIVTKGRAEADATNQDMNYFLGIQGGVLAADFEEGLGTCVGGPTPGAACWWTCTNDGSRCSLDSQCSGGTCTLNTCGSGGTCSGYGGLNHPVQGTTPIPTGVWRHVAAAYDGACWQLYVDGVADTPGTACPGRPARADSIQHFAVGTAMTSGGAAAGRFHGRIDDARVWNVVRTEAQIQASMHDALTSATGLVGHWSLDEGAGTVANDSTATNADGTIAGNAVWDLGDVSEVGVNTCLSTALDCDDGNYCTSDLCSNGACDHEAANDGLPCNDGSGCTYDDLCAGGECSGTVSCDDGNACTTDSCVAAACTHAYWPTPGCCVADADCNDGRANTIDTCSSGECSNSPNPTCTTNADCDDSSPCTADRCQPDPFSLEFDGTNDFVTMGAAPSLNAATFTLECWFKRTSAGAGVTTGTGGLGSALPLVTKGRGEGDATPNLNMNYFMGIDTNGYVLAADFEDTAGGGNHPARGTTTIPVDANTWHHGAATYDGTTWRLYLDGNLEATVAAYATPESTSIQHSGIGSALTSTGVAAGFFGGRIDEARIWNRALTQAEIQASMHVAVASGAGLIGRWGLDEGTGAVAGDSTAPTADGTLTGGPVWSEDHTDLGTGTCENTPANESGACDDGNPATVNDICTGGVCAGTDLCAGVTCTALDPCHAAGVCDPQTGLCSDPAKADGTPCDDGNPATVNDICTGGVCAGTDLCAGVTCTALDPCHAAGVCDPQTGLCSDPAKADGTPCDDGNPATVNDICTGGVCAGTDLCAGVTCTALNSCHDAGTCDPLTGLCSNPVKPDGAACTDGDLCTTGETCSGGVCASGSATCNDGAVCTTDSCTATNVNTAALDFDGAGYVTMGAAAGEAQLGAHDFTLEAWIKRDGATWGTTAYTGSGGITAVPLITKGLHEADGSNVDCNYFLGIATSGRLAADFEDYASGQNRPGCGTAVVPTDGAWHHVAVTYGRTAGWQFYVDGVQGTAADGTSCSECTNTAICPRNPGVEPRYDGRQHFGLGTAMNSSGTTEGRYAGMMDEARVWNYARSAAEIQAGMRVQVPSMSGLIGRWGLNDGFANPSAATAVDSTTTPTQSNGTLTGFTLPGAWKTIWLETFGQCDYTPIQGCCTSDTQCSDGEPCTNDLCVGNVCSNPAIPGCGPCTVDANCDDLNACTQNTCNTKTDYGLQFTSASSQYMTMGIAPGLGASQFTLEAWIKQNAGTWGVTTGTGTGGLTAAVPIVTKGRGEEDGTNKDCNYFMGISGGKLAADFEEGLGTCSGGSTPGASCTWRCSNDANKICNVDSQCTSPGVCTANTCGGGGTCVGRAGLNHPVTGATTLSTTDWTHVAATYDGTTWRLYVNGALDATSVVGDRLPRADSIQHFGIATAMTSTPAAAGYLSALVDEVRVWNRALSQPEIQANKNRELRSGSGLVGRWGLNEGSGSLAADSTTPAENGTLSGTVLPAWVSTSGGQPPIGTDMCEYPALDNGTACSDGNICTQTDACQAGICTGSNPVICTALDQCHTAGICDPGTGVCSNPPRPDGMTCSDGDACTAGDHCAAGICVITSFACAVTGNVYYYRDSTDPEGVEDTSTKGVPDIILAMTGHVTGTAVSANPAGDYHFNAGGNVTVTPQAKLGMFVKPGPGSYGSGISSLDASRIAQSSVESIVLTARQQIAADVSGNARITSYDAALVAQLVVSLIPRFPVAESRQSDWAYVPLSRSYTVGGDVTGADFLGILYGDVTANWGEPAAGFRAAASGDSLDEDPAGRRWLVEQAGGATGRAATPASKGATVYLASGPARLPDGRFEVVLGIREADGILAIDLSLAFNPAVVGEVSVERAGLSSGMALTQNGRDGRHAVSLYGVAPMQGAGPFLKVVYRSAGRSIALPFSVSAEANEGQIPLSIETSRPRRAARG